MNRNKTLSRKQIRPLAPAAETVSLSEDEHRNAVHRSLYDRPQNQSVFRLWTYASGDRPLASDGERGAARGDGATRLTHGGRGPDAAGGRQQFENRLTDTRIGGAL
jgi:hypothetical protein